MDDGKIKYCINKGLERLQSNSEFPPKSIIDDNKFIPNYAFTNNDYKLFYNWISVIMEVKAVDTSKSFFIPCILRKVPEQRYNGRINDIYYRGCNQFSINESYIEDLEIVLNERYFKILVENNFIKDVYYENEYSKSRQNYSDDENHLSTNMMKLSSRKCNLAFYPYSFSMLAYTLDINTWNKELINIGITEDKSFNIIKRLSKKYFTINDVSLGTFISKLPLNQEYNYNGNGYDNIIMKCTCNSLSLVFYTNITLTVDKIENHAITDSISNGVYTKDKKNKPNIIITNDEFLI